MNLGERRQTPFAGQYGNKVKILYQLSDDALEYQINDRLSFKQFLGLDVSEKTPDAKTIFFGF